MAHLRVHQETAEAVEVVYLEKDGSLVELEVNDIPMNLPRSLPRRSLRRWALLMQSLVTRGF